MVKDKEAWRAAVHGVAKSWTWLSDWKATSSRLKSSVLSTKLKNISQLLGNAFVFSVFYPGEFHELYSPWGRGAEHNWVTFTVFFFFFVSISVCLSVQIHSSRMVTGKFLGCFSQAHPNREAPKVKVLVAQSILCPWNSQGKKNRVGCHSILQGIFLTQGLNLGLLHCRHILYPLNHQEV